MGVRALRSQPRGAARASWVAVALLCALEEARADEARDVEGRADAAPIALIPALTPPTWMPVPVARLSGIDLHVRHGAAAPHPLRLSLDLSVSYLRLAVHGDYKAGLAPYLGTSTTSLGGFRLRF